MFFHILFSDSQELLRTKTCSLSVSSLLPVNLYSADREAGDERFLMKTNRTTIGTTARTAPEIRGRSCFRKGS
jgi:hypothetical protein